MNRLLIAGVVAVTACSSEPRASIPMTGAELFARHCAICHGATGAADTSMARGYPNANLADGVFVHGGSPEQIRATIREGVPRTPMLSMRMRLSDQEIDRVANHVLQLSQ